MELKFDKWHGTGNDFILVDDRAGDFPSADERLVQRLCHRHFGIGGDGLILIQAPLQEGTDYHMEFYNPDASRSFCGNGSRCAFAFWGGLTGRSSASFTAIDGRHDAAWSDGQVGISLPPVSRIEMAVDGPQVDRIHTGSPHELVWVDEPDAIDIMLEGPRRRHAAVHAPQGTNVNFLRLDGTELRMRTFERGVEAETLSCGSGVVAAALSALHRRLLTAPVNVRTRGGRLRVECRYVQEVGYDGIRLIGPVAQVFQGLMTI